MYRLFQMKILCLVVLADLLLSACGTLQVGIETPPPTPEPEITVAGWQGYVQEASTGTQYDDYLVLLPQGTGEFGLVGATPEIESQIVALRNQEGPGKVAHFWGVLRCGIPDYNSCQLSVDRFRIGIDTIMSEPVQGWPGNIVSVEPDAEIDEAHLPSGRSPWVFGYQPKDDAFVLSGKYPVRFGIASSIAENGLPVYALKLVGLRDSGEPIQIWGEMDCGETDTNGCTIWVSRLDVAGTPVDPYQDWLTYTNTEYGFSFMYPPNWYLHSEVPASDEGDLPLMNFINLSTGDLWLQIGYKFASEEGVLGTGVGAGDLLPRDPIHFLGQQVKKEWLVYNDGVKNILYDMTIVDGLSFAFRLSLTSEVDYETAVISPESEFEIDLILSTLLLISQ
ncbi:MAG: hypothetical protein A2136_02115 [Chloroflexi bacterium RBG_16_54_11]|nr:MAG: hypothetical protein A2136_02115 [Chloroflexi bacterium RBG_16_54_11]